MMAPRGAAEFGGIGRKKKGDRLSLVPATNAPWASLEPLG